MASNSRQLTLTVTEQPAKLHRFRYLKEIKDGRMGSILHSRTSAKTPVKVKVTSGYLGNAWYMCRLICCTVFDDQTPHPFYLLGDDCDGGVFQKDFTLSAGNSEQEISLERIGIVCTPKKQPAGSKAKSAVGANANASPETVQDGGGSYQQRMETFNFFNKVPKCNPFQGKDVNKLRLAFQVLTQVPESKEWVAADCEPVATDVISDAKIYSVMTVDYVIPKTVPRLNQDVWLYMKDQLPGEAANRFKVIVEESNQKSKLPWELPVKSVKKHLIVFNFASVENLRGDLSLSVSVADKETGDTSEPVQLKLNLPLDGSAEPASKRRRGERTDIASITEGTGDILNDLMVGFADEMIDSELHSVQDFAMQQEDGSYIVLDTGDQSDVPVLHMASN